MPATPDGGWILDDEVIPYGTDDPKKFGGPGSGHHGHAGRPGERGGSAPGSGGSSGGGSTDSVSEKSPSYGKHSAGFQAVPAVGSFGVRQNVARDMAALDAARAGLSKIGITPKTTTERFDAVLAGESMEDIQKWGGWYDNQMRAEVDRLALKYGITDKQAAGILASMSPQMKWGDNIDSRTGGMATKDTPEEFRREWQPGDVDRNNQWAAESIVRAYTEGKEVEVTKNDLAYAAKRLVTKPMLEEKYGKNVKASKLTAMEKLAAIPGASDFYQKEDGTGTYKLNELPPEIAAVVHRVPGITRTKGVAHYDENKMVLPQAVRQNAVAFSIMQGKDPDDALSGLKVRSFYNNGLAGADEENDVTINGHMAALMMDVRSPAEARTAMLGKGVGPKGSAQYVATRELIDAYHKKNGAKYGFKSPKQMQAALWVARRKKLGESAWERLTMETTSKRRKKAAHEE